MLTIEPRLTRLVKPGPITVRLPPAGEPYVIQYGLFTKGSNNPKLRKNEKSGEYRTWGLSLAPAMASGYQVCPSASAGCIAGCLHKQGHARVFRSIHRSRIAKTIAFFEHRQWFEERLRWELEDIVRLAERRDFEPVVRLNVYSDILWERLFGWVFAQPIQFYDYTKHANRMRRWCSGMLPENYHLTFSRSEDNEADCLDILERGGNVAVVFRHKTLPKTWRGWPVVNGDETDLRFLDPPGSVIGLYAKGTSVRDRSGFVVRNRLLTG